MVSSIITITTSILLHMDYAFGRRQIYLLSPPKPKVSLILSPLHITVSLELSFKNEG